MASGQIMHPESVRTPLSNNLLAMTARSDVTDMIVDESPPILNSRSSTSSCTGWFLLLFNYNT